MTSVSVWYKIDGLVGTDAPQLHIVKNLAIEHDPDRAILVVDRLVAAGQVDDTQTPGVLMAPSINMPVPSGPRCSRPIIAASSVCSGGLPCST
jgi:hypothetical protein